ncbi:DoxX family protein [Cohnella zeiphila]|uniref:DoxX family protein n=1 Tax=Cohnella zeiphila TaxID=2761120 RepID=A0A7X0SPV0_9BACL|nr:DoxX family protein [Cohnella zeiphila]MBB6733967.1 DoxX family protein [Cohnella zeiphila]
MSSITVEGTDSKTPNRSRKKAIAYWVATVLLVFVVGAGGIGELTRQWGTMDTVKIVGYPIYFLTILGTWKVLGAIALLVPGFPRLKEWAYAGIVFGMTGAAASHAFADDIGAYAYHLFSPLGFAILALISWALRPKSRTLKEVIRWRSDG